MDTKIGSFAKVSPPAMTQIIHRTRLFNWLESRSEQPICWVNGPAGCGKTTLVASYIDYRKLTCLWYQIDAGDADPASFFYHLGLAAQKAAPRRRMTLPLLTPEYLAGLPVFALRFFEALYNRLRLPIALVFDNYQEVSPDAQMHELVRQGLAHVPKGVNVFLCSRANPPAGFARLRANGQMAHLEWQDLRLTLEETAQIASLRSEAGLAEETLRILHERTDGWAAGVSLLLEKGPAAAIQMHPSDPQATTAVFDYFAGEVFNRLEKRLQDLLIKTAFFPAFNLEMAQALSGDGLACSLLNGLERKNFFITRQVHDPIFYQYHPLFCAFLRAKAQETLSAEALTELRQATADLLEKNGKIDAAIVLWLEIKNWQAVVQMILRQAKILLEQGRFQVLASWLEQLPEEWVDANPWLLFYQSLCQLPLNPHTTGELAAKAYHGFKKVNDGAGQLLSWAAVIDSFTFGMLSYKDLDDWIDEFETFKADYELLPIGEIKAKVASCLVAALTAKQPRHPDIPYWAQSALSLCDAVGLVGEQIKLRFQLIFFHSIFSGDFRTAGAYVDEMEQLARQRELTPLNQIMIQFSKCQYFEAIGQSAKNLEAGSKGLELSAKTGATVLDVPLRGLMALGSLDLGHLARAAEHIAAIERQTGSFDLTAQFMNRFIRARYFLIQGKHDEAHVLIDRNLAQKEKTDNKFCNTLAGLQKAQVLCLKGDHEAALTHIDGALQPARQVQSPHQISTLLLEKAHIELEQGHRQAGLASLREAFHLSRSIGFMHTYFDLPASTALLCAKAIEAGIEIDFVRRIVHTRQFILETPCLHLEAWPWPIRIYTLGPFELLREEKSIPLGRKTPQKPLELLKLILAGGAQGVSEDSVADVLWPAADGDNAQRALKTTLHRLRALLGYDQVIQHKGGRIRLDPRYVWTDVWAFDALHDTLVAAKPILRNADDTTTWVRECETALALYRDDFLIDESWAPVLITKRQEVRRRFMRIVERLGHYLEVAQQWEEAAALYQKTVATQGCSETVFGRLMQCYGRLGRRDEALAVYERCATALSNASGMRPSPWIEALHQSLKRPR